MDDLLTNSTNYTIKITLPKYYYVSSNLNEYKTPKGATNEFLLLGQKKTEVLLNIDTKNHYKSFKTTKVEIKTDLYNTVINMLITVL